MYDPDSVNDSLYVTTTECVKGRYVVSGFDLKIILNWRITLFPTEELEAGTYGYDIRQGYTGNIIKGYIDYNLCEASDPNRRLNNCWCAAAENIGIENDTYMSRLQPLNEVVEALCANAGIGYDVFFDYLSDGSIGINVYEGKDRRSGGIAFGTYIGNSDGIKLIRDNTAERSVVWAVNGIGVKDCTVTAVDLSGSSSAGIERKEAVVTTNCSVADISIYAKKAAEDYTATEEIDASADGSGYGDLFNVGDVVRVFDDGGGTSEMRILSVEKQFSGHSRRIKLSFADYFKPKPRKKVVNKLSAANTENKKDIVDQKIDTASGGEENNGLTINQAVIIKEEDAKYLLHNFSQVEYIAGNKIGYTGPGNQIVLQGTICYKLGGIAPNGKIINNITSNKDPLEIPDIPLYTSLDFSPAIQYSSKFYVGIKVNFVRATNVYTIFQIVGAEEDQKETVLSSINVYDNNGVQIALLWSEINAPSDPYPYGYAKARIVYRCLGAGGMYQVYTITNMDFTVPFFSLAEYQAAVGLTYEPITLTEVVDNPTVVSGKEVE